MLIMKMLVAWDAVLKEAGLFWILIPNYFGHVAFVYIKKIFVELIQSFYECVCTQILLFKIFFIKFL